MPTRTEVISELASTLEAYMPSGGNLIAGCHIVEDSIVTYENSDIIEADLDNGQLLTIEVRII